MLPTGLVSTRIQGGRSAHPVKTKRGGIRYIFITFLTRSSLTDRLFFYKLKIFVQLVDSICGDWRVVTMLPLQTKFGVNISTERLSSKAEFVFGG